MPLVYRRPKVTEEDGQYARGRTISWKQLTDEHCDYLLDKGRSTKHVYDTRLTMEDIAAWYTGQGLLPGQVNARNGWACLREYRARGMRHISVKHRECKFRAVFSWAYRQELFEKNLLEKMERWEVRDESRRTDVSEDIIDRIVCQMESDWADDTEAGGRFKSLEARRFFRFRDPSLTLALADSGMRIGEATNARLCNLSQPDSLGRRTLLLENTKNGDDRYVCFTAAYCAGPLSVWLEIRTAISAGSDYIWITENGNKIDPSSWGKQFNRYCRRAGIDQPVRRHDLRHRSSSAHDLIDWDLSKEIHGHRTDVAHGLYSHQTEEKINALKDAHEAAAPVANVLAKYQARADARDAALKLAASGKQKRKRVYTK